MRPKRQKQLIMETTALSEDEKGFEIQNFVVKPGKVFNVKPDFKITKIKFREIAL